MPPDQAPAAETAGAASQDFHILLKPVSHPELGEIPIDDDLFAIGRTEAPFASYPPAIVDALSRRHARIFCERGHVFVADLGSKNGTTVNGLPVRERPSRLRDGDEVSFGGELSFRVQLGTRREKPAAGRLVGITLNPERDDLGLEPIAITRFPFLVSKSDEAFARYRDEYPHQVNYVSRRHAHIFVKGGVPYLEDLGSTNGTFVAGRRLDEHAVPLEEGDVIAFGGHHFVYRVHLVKEQALDPTVTKVAFQSGGEASVDTEKTTFVAAADSFLDIFCVDEPRPAEDEVNDEAGKPPEEPGKTVGRKRGRLAIFASELMEAFSGGERGNLRRYASWAGGALALVVLAGIALHFRGASEREVRDLLAEGQYAQAAAAADRYLDKHPDNAELKALGTEALLKANVPQWIAQLKAKDFKGAAATLAGMGSAAAHNPDARSLVGELAWLGNLEQFYGSRGGGEAPIRIYTDEERIQALLKPWDEDALGHQRAFDRIAAFVPEFKDFYAEALSHLRKIQSDDSVYLGAIERLKTTIAAELNRDRPEVLEAAFKDYGEKYPRLGGLDVLREDLRRYQEIEAEMRARRPGRVAALLARGPFATPPFQAKVRALAAGGQLPPADVLAQYQAVAKAWREGDAQQALSRLEQLGNGPWADSAARELARKKAVARQFAELQAGKDAKGYDERLLAFYGSLDPEEDGYFIHAVEGDIAANREQALRHAQEQMNRAQALWARYRENGAIGEEQRSESSLSKKFDSQARLLSDALAGARQGARIYGLLKAEVPAQWAKLQEDITGEVEMQRRALLDLRSTLEPGLLKSKLALLGDRGSEQGQSP
ncbi:MAG TPA: FHA domain-containing protein [Rhodocyclaceae bacterium]|nr:FHA domain-containing protein [Rhodocyclaceae bacterium]